MLFLEYIGITLSTSRIHISQSISMPDFLRFLDKAFS